MTSHPTQRRIAHTFHHIDLKNRHVMELVACDDGTIGIVFDGELVPALWPPEDAESCIDVYANFIFLHGGSLEEIPELIL